MPANERDEFDLDIRLGGQEEEPQPDLMTEATCVCTMGTCVTCQSCQTQCGGTCAPHTQCYQHTCAQTCQTCHTQCNQQTCQPDCTNFLCPTARITGCCGPGQ
jgi:hypothetical protein